MERIHNDSVRNISISRQLVQDLGVINQNEERDVASCNHPSICL